MRTCIVCGCTDEDACVAQFSPHEEPTTCTWIHAEGDPPVCSFCAEEDVRVDPGSELILPGDPEFHL